MSDNQHNRGAAAKQYRPPVSIFTAHVGERETRLVVTGQHGTLALTFSTDGPYIDFPDWERGHETYKAVCGLEANGRLRGFFGEKKGDDKTQDTPVFIPTMTRREGRPRVVARPPEQKPEAPYTRRGKKGGKP